MTWIMMFIFFLFWDLHLPSARFKWVKKKTFEEACDCRETQTSVSFHDKDFKYEGGNLGSITNLLSALGQRMMDKRVTFLTKPPTPTLRHHLSARDGQSHLSEPNLSRRQHQWSQSSVWWRVRKKEGKDKSDKIIFQ